MRIIIINGPNLNLLGKRQPEIYGEQDFESYLKDLQGEFTEQQISYFQSNVEGEIINKIQACEGEVDAMLLNAGGYTHTSVAIADALASCSFPIIEVHISNIHAREEFRHVSLTAKHAKGVIAGFGLEGYRMGLQSFIALGN